MKIRRLLFPFLLSLVGMVCASKTYANDIYANKVTDSSSDFQNAYRVADANQTNFADISTLLGVLTTSYLQVDFPVSGIAGDNVNVIIQQGSGQLLNANVLNSVTLDLYDSLGNHVKSVSGSSLLQLSLLSLGANISAVSFATNPTDGYTFKRVKVSFTSLLSVNLINEFRVYGVFYQTGCPTTLANAVYATTPAGVSSTDNPGDAVDASTTNFAQLNVPIQILGLVPPAYLDVSFPQPAHGGEFVGFTVSPATGILLSLGVLSNTVITLYDQTGATVATQTFTSLAQLQLLPGSTNQYSIGATAPGGRTSTVVRARITLNSGGSLLTLGGKLDVYNGYHYLVTRPEVVTSASGPTSFCNGGSVTLTASDPLGATNFIWSTGEMTPSITVNSSETVSVIVVDPIYCNGSSIPESITDLPPVMAQIIGDTVLCNGASGVLKTAVPYAHYVWSNSTTAATLPISNTGKYYVSVTDSNNCKGSDTVTVKRDSLMLIPGIINASCNTGNTGSIVLDVVNNSKYTYLWSDGSVTPQIANKPAGLYAVIIKDTMYGCSYNRAYNIASGNTLSSEVFVINTSDTGKADGQAGVHVDGGSGSYTYVWSNNNAVDTNVMTGLQPGIYTVTVNDNTTHCTTEDTVVVSTGGNNPLNINDVVIGSSSCNASNGSITAVVTGGSGNYTYLWSTGANTAAITNLQPGTYYLLVTDNVHHYTKALTAKVNSLVALVIGGTSVGASCSMQNGSAVSGVTGGSGNYSYKWSNGATTANINNLMAGTYIVTVTDNATGCTATKTFVVGTTNGPAVTIAKTNPTTAGNNGSITLTTPSTYTYLWSNGSTAQNQVNLQPGTYVVTITDTTTGCSTAIAITLTGVTPLKVTATPTPNTSCVAPYNGSVSLTVTGGDAPYTYLWSTGAVTQNITMLNAGFYTITVRDADTTKDMFVVPVTTDSTNLLKGTIDSVIAVSCIDSASGKIYTHASNGSGPGTYKYTWSNGAMTKDLIDVVAGHYTLVISDLTSCIVTLSADLSKAMLNLNVNVTSPKCFGDTTGGSIVVTVDSGSGHYLYTWSNDTTADSSITNLAPGFYSVLVTDTVSGCQKNDTIAVTQPSQLVVTPNITNETCAGGDGQIVLSVYGGVSPYTYSWGNTNTTNEMDHLTAGNYNVTVTDSNNCTSANSYVVTRTDCDSINIHNVITPNGDGVNDVLVIDGISNYPDNNLQILDKWGDVVFEQQRYNSTWGGQDKHGNKLASGTYYFLLKLNAAHVPNGKSSYTGYIMIQ